VSIENYLNKKGLNEGLETMTKKVSIELEFKDDDNIKDKDVHSYLLELMYNEQLNWIEIKQELDVLKEKSNVAL
tara:strand:+ start:154 stop:375 length:222 start_codon:yes stop_codon:yes gene_type:complete